ERPWVRDELIAALPNGATVTVDGESLPASRAVDEAQQALKDAAKHSGEAKRLRKVEQNEEAAEDEDEEADRCRARAYGLIGGLFRALGTATQITAAVLEAPGRLAMNTARRAADLAGEAAGSVLEPLLESAIDAMEGAAAAAGID